MNTIAPLTARICTAHHWLRRPGEKGPSHVNAPLTEAAIESHLNGGNARGACPIAPGTNTTQCALLDLDSHKGEIPWPQMVATALEIIDALAEADLHGIPFRSSGGQGIHIYLLWREPQDAFSVREALKIALAKCGLKSGVGGLVKGEVEVFPKQDDVPADGFGSMFVLPLWGKSTALRVGDE